MEFTLDFPLVRDIVEAFSAAMCSAGYDVDVYELNRALDAALSELGARERFKSGLKPFTSLSGDQVAAEFDGWSALLSSPVTAPRLTVTDFMDMGGGI